MGPGALIIYYAKNIKDMPDTTQVNVNARGKEANSYDAIVIGSGIAADGQPRNFVKKD